MIHGPLARFMRAHMSTLSYEHLALAHETLRPPTAKVRLGSLAYSGVIRQILRHLTNYNQPAKLI